MIDIHSHILPSIDDGPGNVDESIRMAELASADGATHMVATPHTLNGLYVNSRPGIHEKIENFRNILEGRGIPLVIIPGSDVALTAELIPAFDAGDIMTINDGGRYILAELPLFFSPLKIYDLIFSLRTRGITPIITHPERDEAIMKKPSILEELIERGCLCQITAMSLTGGFGEDVKEFSLYLLKQRMVHFIGSDCHSPERRRPGLSRAVSMAADIVGADLAGKMVNDFPMAVVEGKDPGVPPYIPLKKRSRFRFWKRS